MLLKAPEIVILDEATAHLDSESELLVQQALAQALTGRTSLVIAHRLSTMLNADQVLVIDDGRVVERGTHADLLERRRALRRALPNPVRATGRLSQFAARTETGRVDTDRTDTGSASRAAKAISAAPSKAESAPNAGWASWALWPGASRAYRSSSRSRRCRRCRGHGPAMPPRMTRCGLSVLTMLARSRGRARRPPARTALSRDGVAVACGGEDLVDDLVARRVGAPGEREQRRLPDVGLQQPLLPQWQAGPEASTTTCPISPAWPSRPRSRQAVGDDPGTDADPADEVHDVVATRGRCRDGARRAAARSASLPTTTGRWGVASSRQELPERRRRASRGSERSQPCPDVGRPCRARSRRSPTGRSLRATICCKTGTISTMCRATCAGESGVDPAGTTCRARTVPPIPIAAAVTWVTSRSTATTNGPCECGPTTCDGRPAAGRRWARTPRRAHDRSGRRPAHRSSTGSAPAAG